MLKSLLLSAVIASSTLADPFVLNLGQLQTPSGGFRDLSSETPDLEATANALFLASLYGVETQINAGEAFTYVQNLGNPNDFGYALSEGLTSDLEATRYALLSYAHLKREIPNKEQVGDFIRSLFKVEEGLFAARPSEAGDLKSTSLAVEALTLIGDLKKPAVRDLLDRIKTFLNGKVAAEGDGLRFVFSADSATPISDNYYGIYLATASGFEFTDVSKWVAYINAAQDVDQYSPTFGGFRVSAQGAVSAEATAHAVRTLTLLNAQPAQEVALFQFVKNRKSSLKETAFAHLAFASTSVFKHTLAVKVAYQAQTEFSVSDLIVEGVQITPVAAVTIFDNKAANGAFAATVREKNGDWESNLQFDSTTGHYVAVSSFDTNGKLGSVVFEYAFSSNVYPIGQIDLEHTDVKTVGYFVNVEETVKFNGADVTSTEVVPGTEFGFSLTLSTQNSPKFVSGDFDLTFQVIDASGVVQSSSKVDGRTNADSIDFVYTLTGRNVPAGALTFSFEVKNADGVHTTKTRVFTVVQDMVASHVDLSNNQLRLGDAFVVSFQPGTRDASQLVTGLDVEHADKRNFVLTLVSSSDAVVLSLPSTAIEASGETNYKAVFRSNIPSNLDFIGTFTLVFRFDDGPALVTDEVYRVTIDASLRIAEVSDAPQAGQRFLYGNAISPKFKLLDTVSNGHVAQGEHSEVAAVVFIGQAESVRAPAKADSINWFNPLVAIDVNALAGSGKLAVLAKGSSGQAIPILSESGSGAAEYPLTIGGEIKVESSSYTTHSADSDHSAFVVTFKLTCGGAELPGARLLATVVGPSRTWSGVHVALDDPSSRYSLGFSVPHHEAKSGKYTLKFIRVSDIQRARDARASDAGADVSDSDLKVQPLFEIDLHHSEVKKGGNWMQMELFATVVLATLFAGIFSNVKALSKKLA